MQLPCNYLPLLLGAWGTSIIWLLKYWLTFCGSLVTSPRECFADGHTHLTLQVWMLQSAFLSLFSQMLCLCCTPRRESGRCRGPWAQSPAGATYQLYLFSLEALCEHPVWACLGCSVCIKTWMPQATSAGCTRGWVLKLLLTCRAIHSWVQHQNILGSEGKEN